MPMRGVHLETLQSPVNYAPSQIRPRVRDRGSASARTLHPVRAATVMRRPRHVRANLRFWWLVVIPRIKVNLAVLLLHVLSSERR